MDSRYSLSQFYDVPTPPAYWKAGVNLVPNSVQMRRADLDDYRRLLYGDYAPLDLNQTERVISINHFDRVVQFLVDLLMAFPPEVDGMEEEMRDPFNDMLRDLLTQRFALGTGLMYVHSEGIDSIDPRYWYPWPYAAGDTIAEEHIVVRDDGQIDSETHVRLIKLGVEAPGTVEWWSATSGVLQQQLSSEPIPAMERSIIPCPRPPSEGEWGRSLIADMIPMVKEIVKRYSGISDILDYHSRPVLSIKRSGENPINTGYRQGGKSTVAALRIEQIKLEGIYSQNLAISPEGYEDPSYITWDGQLASNFQQIAQIEDAMFSTTGVPAALQGVMRGQQAPSGVALKRMYTSTYVLLEQVQHDLIPKMRRALELFGISNPVITWLNPIEQLDTVQVVQGAKDPDEREIETGEVADNEEESENESE